MNLQLNADIMQINKQCAEKNRTLFEEKSVKVVNIIGSPGAGKTTLLESLIKVLSHKLNIGVIEGDLATANDAERIRACGVPVIQINTAGGCHLDAKMIEAVLPVFDLAVLDLLIIENVGNLVCPCDFDLGENVRLLVLSTPEGEDKPQKYPSAVLSTDAVIINKMDLLPYLSVDVKKMCCDILDIKPQTPIFELSALKAEGLDALCKYLKNL